MIGRRLAAKSFQNEPKNKVVVSVFLILLVDLLALFGVYAGITGIIDCVLLEICLIPVFSGLAPFPIRVANEGLGWDPLLKT